MPRRRTWARRCRRCPPPFPCNPARRLRFRPPRRPRRCRRPGACASRKLPSGATPMPIWIAPMEWQTRSATRRLTMPMTTATYRPGFGRRASATVAMQSRSMAATAIITISRARTRRTSCAIPTIAMPIRATTSWRCMTPAATCCHRMPITAGSTPHPAIMTGRDISIACRVNASIAASSPRTGRRAGPRSRRRMRNGRKHRHARPTGRRIAGRTPRRNRLRGRRNGSGARS